MPGFVWNGEEARKIAYLWPNDLKSILYAWVWNGEAAVLWYDRSKVPSLDREKEWSELVGFTEEELVERYTIKGEQDGFTVVLIPNLEKEPRDVAWQWGETSSFTELEALLKDVFVDEQDSFSIAGGWTEELIERPETGLAWDDEAGFTDDEDVETSPTIPEDFLATHDEIPCPTIRVDLSWSNGDRSELKTLQIWNYTTSSWDTISTTIATGATTYDDHLPSADQISGDNVQYRIKFNSESTWATDTACVICPE